MAYEIFEHNNVRYKLFLGNHIRSSYPMVKASGKLKDLDVLVLEGSKNPERIMESLDSIQYSEFLSRIPEENPNISVYYPDIFPSVSGVVASISSELLQIIPMTVAAESITSKKKEISRREALKAIGRIGVGLFFGLSYFGNFINAFYDGEDIEIISEANAIKSSALPNPIVGFRDAAIARIVEEYILPNEMQEGKELNVGIIFGAAHSGIEQKIRNKLLRDTTISAYESLGYPGILKNDLSKIVRLRYENGRYVIKEISINLF